MSDSLLSPEQRYWESQLHSFVTYCDGSEESHLTAENSTEGLLAGYRVGVKDIIDVRGVPTRNGSALCEHVNAALYDAPVVAGLKAAGARIIGKTTTTEFAFTDPTDCRNPYDSRRTPGGSSSGSGAAVAAGFLDLALGTQTAGSLCRPAAYCGVVGFKPSYGVLSTQGVTPLAVSFDTVGVIAKSVKVAHDSFATLTQSAGFESSQHVRFSKVLFPTENQASDDTLAALAQALDTLLGAGLLIDKTKISINVSEIVSAHRTVMNAEAAQVHKNLLSSNFVELLKPNFRAALQAGHKLSPSQIAAARRVLRDASEWFWKQLEGVDLILSLPVPEGAPLLDGTTGFQDWLTPWTVFGGPLLCLPWGLDTLGRPRSVMLAGRPGDDNKVLEVARQLELLSPILPRPRAPVGFTHVI
ncbi:MAG: amidase [Granulosicoccus sp.]|nr:amidase [Granulosicoccus sp.]